MTNCSNVIFCEVSYSRNIKDTLFVNKLSDGELAISIVRSLSEIFGEDFEFKSLKNIPFQKCLELEEEGIITKELIENKDISAYGLNDNKECKVFVNEKDHIRMIAKKSGFNFEEAFTKANELDDIVLDKLEMAFDNNIGYLTADPNMAGTGMKVSCGLFLPSLTFSGKLKRIINDLLGSDFELRDLNGEKYSGKSPFVMVVNKYTFGKKENEFAMAIKVLVEKIVQLEKNEENNQFELSASTLVDDIFRAYGTSLNAYRLSYAESEEIIGRVLWGLQLKMLKFTKRLDILSLLDKIKENHLSFCGNVKEIEKRRAKILNDNFKLTICKAEVDV